MVPTVAEALTNPNWKAAIRTEMDAHETNKTWPLVNLRMGRKLIRGKWVFASKQDAQGKAVRLKARWTAKGFTQIEGVDFHATFAPVARMSTLRVLISLALFFDADLQQLDFDTAYLNADISEEVYDDKSGRVCKLNKALYGTKQAANCWYKTLHATLTSLGWN